MARLPIVDSSPRGIKPSRASRWRATVLVLIHLAIAAHITHWLATGSTLTPVEPSEAAAFSRSGIVNTGLIFFAATIVLTAVFGRFFCGWACHLVALQDLSRALLIKFGRRPKELRSRLLAWVPALAFVYLFLWPFVQRWRQGDELHTGTELTTTEFWATFPGWAIGLLTFLVCGVLVVYFLGSKGFCTYACPYGAAFSFVDRLSPMRIRVTDACAGCGHCTATCSSNVRVHEEVRDFGMVVDSGCMKCLDCVSVCPNDALYYGAGPLPLFAKPRASGRSMRRFPLSWPEELVAALAFVLGFLVFRGSYGSVSILMALGMAGVLAYLTLVTFQLATKPNLSFKGWALKRAGRLRRAGVLFLVGMTVVVAGWAHSGAVRWYIAQGDSSVPVIARWQSSVYDLSAPRPVLGREETEIVEAGIEGYRRSLEIGVFDSMGVEAHIALLSYLQGDDEGAFEAARSSIEQGALVPRMHLLLGRIAFDSGDLDQAAREYELADAAGHHDGRGLSNLGRVRAQQGRLDDAERAFRAVIDEHGETASRAYDLGLALAYAERLDESTTWFERTLALDPSHLPARENLAGVLAAAGRLEESVAQYRTALDQSPNDPATRTLLAQVLAALGRPDEAVVELDRALRADPGFAPAQQLRAALVQPFSRPPT